MKNERERCYIHKFLLEQILSNRSLMAVIARQKSNFSSVIKLELAIT